MPCRKGCDRTFKNTMARNMHEIRTHGKGWSTTGNFKSKRKHRFPSDDPAYRKAHYQKKKRMSKKARANISAAQLVRRANEKLLNGSAPTAPAEDHLSDAARSIIVAAQVLRAVAVGMKL